MVKSDGKWAVKKPRSKVSKACENCRRRKIKCTGRQPCNNCITYGCDCIFTTTAGANSTNGSSNSIGSFNGNIMISQLNMSNNETIKEPAIRYTGASSTPKTNGRSDTGKKTVAADGSLDPVIDCVHDALNNGTSQSNDSEDGSFEKFADCIISSTLDKTEMDQERDLTTLKPIQPIFGDNGLYGDDTEFQLHIMQLQSSLKQLKAIPNSSELIRDAVAKIEEQFEELAKKWQPDFDLSQASNISSNNNGLKTYSKSLETQLMRNKYSKHVHLTVFSSVSENNNYKEKGGSDGNFNEDKGNSNGKINGYDNASKKSSNSYSVTNSPRSKPLVDSVFGLYSPMQSVSLTGIGHFFQKCASGPESKDKTIQLKETLYLLLKFFDICISDVGRSCVSIANPLEDYLRKRNLFDSIKSISSPNNTQNALQNKDIIAYLIGLLPQPFSQNLTHVTNLQLYDSLNDDFTMFALLLKMFEQHRIGFDNLLARITSRKHGNSISEISSVDSQEFLNYVEGEGVLLALCYHYYNSTLYHFDEFVGNLNYFELLVSFLSTQLWLEEKYGYEKVLDVAINYSRTLGLFRWEFYVGLDEETAERRRVLWWRLYCCEKKYMCKTGRLSSIDDSKMNCLLPKLFRNVGFSDHKDFISRVDLVQRNDIFDGMTVEELIKYGKCAVFQVASNFYANVLYHEHFTSIRNTAKPSFLKGRLLAEAFEEIEKLEKRFESIKHQTSKLFEIANSSSPYNLFVSSKDKNRAVKFALFHGCTLFSILTSAANLVARLYTPPRTPYIVQHSMKFATTTYNLWRNMTALLSSLEDDFTIVRAFVDYGVLCMLLASTSLDKSAFVRNIEEVITVLRVFKRLRSVNIFTKCKDNIIVSQSKSYLSFNRVLIFLGITTNSMLLGYMHDNKLNKEKLFQILEQHAPDLGDLPALVLNPKSGIFDELTQGFENSGFHRDVKRFIEKNGKVDNDSVKENYPKTVVQLTPTGSENASKTPGVPNSASPLSDMRNTESSYPTLPSIKSLTNPKSPKATHNSNNNEPSLNRDTFQSSPRIIDERPNKEDMNNSANPSNTGFNLGTLDDFVNHGDLNDVFNNLWNGLDDNTQVLFGRDEWNEYLSKND